MAKTLMMLVGNADSPFVINELPYLCIAFECVHIFAYNTKDDSELKCKLPGKVVVHHINVSKGWKRFVRYIPIGIKTTVRDLKIRTLNPKRILASLYARGRSECVYKYVVATIEKDDIKCVQGAIYSYWFTDQAIVAWRLAEKLNANGGQFKSYSRAHGYDLYWERNKSGYLPFQDVSLKRLSLVCPCSESGATYLRKKYQKFASKIVVARLGTRDYGLSPMPSTTKIFATCCIFQTLKRMPLFAEAFCSLWKKDNEVHWYCIGTGPDLTRTKEIVCNHNANEAVTFLGNIENPELMRFYQQTAISFFVNVSTSEGVPVTVMEALSFGVPVIATDVGGTSELVSDKCGKLIEASIDAKTLENELRAAVELRMEQYGEKRKAARKVWESMAADSRNYCEWASILSR